MVIYAAHLTCSGGSDVQTVDNWQNDEGSETTLDDVSMLILICGQVRFTLLVLQQIEYWLENWLVYWYLDR